MPQLPTPKQPQPERLKDWYPYYAGFTSAFADAALDRHFDGASRILDPWNGSGTTTTTGTIRGAVCTGIDINPALTVVARARLTPMSISDSLEPIGREVLLAGFRDNPPSRQSDPLGRWFRAPAISTLRRIQHGIHKVVVQDIRLEQRLARRPLDCVDELPLIASFFYTALFATARDSLKPFRASNPTWFRDPATYRNRLNPDRSTLEQRFAKRIRYLASRLTVPSQDVKLATIRTGSVLDMNERSKYDACFTSPPYATRVDYVKSSVAELAVLGLNDEETELLRRRTTGTPVVRGVRPEHRELVSAQANRLLQQVATHTSHGSANYYAPWLRNYLTALEDSLLRIERAVTSPRGRIGVLVQDSYFKAVHVDLQTIVEETLTAGRRTLASRDDSDVRHSLARMNPAARRHLQSRRNSESLLVFS